MTEAEALAEVEAVLGIRGVRAPAIWRDTCGDPSMTIRYFAWSFTNAVEIATVAVTRLGYDWWIHRADGSFDGTEDDFDEVLPQAFRDFVVASFPQRNP